MYLEDLDALQQQLNPVTPDPVSSMNVASIAKAWPHLPSQVTYALGSAGLDANAPAVHQAAQLATKQAVGVNWDALAQSGRDDAAFQSGLAQATQALQQHNDQVIQAQKQAKKYGSLPQDLIGLANTKTTSSGDALRAIRDFNKKYGGPTDLEQIARHKQIGDPNNPKFKALQADHGDFLSQAHQVVQAKLTPGSGGVFGDIARWTGAALAAPLQLGVAAGRAQVGTEVDALKAIGLGGVVDKVLPNFKDNPEAGGNIVAQTTLGQALSGKSLGTGWLPGGEAAQAQAQASRQAASINGHAFTTGRGLASVLIREPDSGAYKMVSGLVDAGVAIKGDPTALALSGFGEARQAAKAFSPVERAAGLEEAGAINGLRRIVVPQTFDQWLAGPTGTKVTQALANTSDFEAVRKSLGGENVALAAKITNSSDPNEIAQLIRDGVTNGSTRLKPTLPNVTYSANRLSPYYYPKGHFSFDNLDQSIENATRLQKAARFSPEQISANNLELASAGSRGEFNNLIYDRLMPQIAEKVSDNPAAVSATKLVKNSATSQALYAVDQMGRPDAPQFISVGGDTLPLARPYREVELANSIPVPGTQDIRNIRRATSPLSALYNTEGPISPIAKTYVNTVGFLDKLNSLFKVNALARPGLAVKIINDESLRRAAGGFNSFYHHPLSYIADVMNGPSKYLDALGEDVQSAARASNLTSAAQAYKDSVLSGQATALAKSGVMGGYTRTTQRVLIDTMDHATAERAPSAWAEEISKLHADEISRRAARMDPAEFGDWFLGSAKRQQLTGWMPELADDNNARAYADFIVRQNRQLAQDDPQILDAIGLGRLNGKPLMNVSGKGALRTNPEVEQDLASRLPQFDANGAMTAEGNAPRYIPADNLQMTRARQGWYDHAVDWIFGKLIDVPTRALSRHPQFMQSYHQGLADLAPYMDPAEYQKMLGQVEKNLAPQSVVSKALGTIGVDQSDVLTPIRNAVPNGSLSLETVDQLAKGRASEVVNNTLHELSARSNVGDALRFVAPFGDAMAQIVKKWAKLTLDNPAVIRRAQQTVEGVKGAGFLHTDPQTGEEMFTFPGTDLISEKLVGVPIPLETRAASWDIIGEGLPNVGPAITLPVAYMLPDTPLVNQIRDKIAPNSTAGNDPLSDALQTFTPTWLRSLYTAAAGNSSDSRRMQRTFVETQEHVMASLASQDPNKYNIHTAAGMRKLTSDAKGIAQKVFVYRAFSQFVLPGSNTSDFQVQDTHGRLMSLTAVGDRLRKLEAEDYDTALPKLVKELGTNVLLAATPVTRLAKGGMPPTNTAAAWLAENPSVKDKYPLVYGYFAPDSAKKDDFSMAEYQRQLDSGERQVFSPDTWLRIANSHQAWMRYDQLAAQSDGSKEDRSNLNQWWTYLQGAYPGFGSDLGLTGKAQPEEVQAQIEQAVKDPALAKTQTGQGVIAYLKARQGAVDDMNALGLKSFGSNKMLEDRQALKGWRDYIAKQYPSAGTLLDVAYSRDYQNIGG